MGARDRLVRIEQLVAACEAHGGRAGAEDDPLLAHLVLPRPRPQEDEVIYVSAHKGTRNSWGTSPATAMTVTSYRGQPSQQYDLGELDPRDDAGFARVLGEWTRRVPFWAGSQAAPIPSSP